MRDRRDWNDIRSTHAGVLEALEGAIAAHPAGKGGARLGERSRLRAVESVADVEAASRRLRPVRAEDCYADDAVVVPFRPRVVTLVPRSHDVEHDPDDPTAA